MSVHDHKNTHQYSHNGPFKLNSEEIDEGTWFSTEAVSKRVINNDPSLTETFKTIWCQYSAKK